VDHPDCRIVGVKSVKGKNVKMTRIMKMNPKTLKAQSPAGNTAEQLGTQAIGKDQAPDPGPDSTDVAVLADRLGQAPVPA
jgi:hypothetical protein